MKNKFYTFILFICFLTTFSFSQELDKAFLDSLPEGIASDLIKRSSQKDSLEETQYRRPSTFIEKPDPTSDRYGAKIFSMMQSSLMPLNEPNFDSSYVLDFGDQLQIQLIGQKSQIDKIIINRDGSISIEDIGKLYIAGLTLNNASNLIKSAINQAFIGVEAYITLTNVRDVQIIMAGNVYNPGSYTLNGNSNIFHALSVSGGPSDIGSFRSIDLLRDGKTIETIDLYDTFINGKPSFNTRLRSGDIIFVNPVKKIVSIYGAVYRPGIYELIENENLSEVIVFANGINPYADINNITLDRVLDGQIKSLSISNISQFDKIQSNAADSIYIRAYPFRTVSIKGAVLNPGMYMMNEGDSINDVIVKSGGMTKSAYPFGIVYEREKVKEINSAASKKLYEDSLDNILDLIKSTGSEADFSPLIGILGQIRNAEPSGRVIVDFDNNSFESIMIEDNDSILIPEKTNQVYIYGASNVNGAAEYVDGKSIDFYIDKMGGLQDDADKKKAYILYPNGESNRINISKNLFIGNEKNVMVYPGSVIYIPESVDNGYASRLSATAYATILGNLGLTLASLSVLGDWWESQ